MDRTMAKAHRHPLLMVLLGLLLAGPGPLGAQGPAAPAPPQVGGGAILVAPTRLVFDDRKRTGEVSLTNTGNGLGKYRIFLVRMEMEDDGGSREQPLEATPGQHAVQDMIRFSPREVNLKPQESQVVRIQIRKPADLPVGEYRLHMVFREEPPQAPEPGKEEEAPKAITIRLTSLFGIAIPLIIRHGETSAKVAITGLALQQETHHLNFRLERTGNQSVYGDLKATFLPKGGKAPRVIAEANGVAVYTPNAFRNLSLALEAGPSANLGPGQLKVTYSTTAEQGGSLLAEGVLEVP